MINNRQNGRRRGRGGQRVGAAPGQQGNGSRIDNRARGNASQLHDKYRALASEAQRQGDRVNTEYYLQFADHYFRVLNENRSRSDEQGQRRQADGFDEDFDGDGDDYGNEGEPARADQYQPRGDDRPRYEERPRAEQGERPRYEDRPRQGQDERPRGEERPRQGQDERPRYDERPRQGQEDRPRRDDRGPRADEGRRPGNDRGQANGARANGNGHARDAAPALPPAASEELITQPQPATAEASTVRAADMELPPRRRGRPRREVSAAEGLDADRLPPSLSVSASAEPDSAPETPAEEVAPPRRRRRAAGALEAPAE